MAMPAAHHRFTVDDYHRMADAGILTEDDRVELLEGQVVVMSPIGGPHVACVVRLTTFLAERLEKGACVSVQNPVLVARHSEPQPDVAVFRRPEGLRGAWIPAARDVLLVIEVADTSLVRDRDEKLPLYARAGIPEAWLVDLTNDAIEIHRAPRAGRYTLFHTARRRETIAPAAFPDLVLRVDDVLG
jgi:Uma2 family endonuclease